MGTVVENRTGQEVSMSAMSWLMSIGICMERFTLTYTLRRFDSSGEDLPQPAPMREAVASTIRGRGGVMLGPPGFKLSVPHAPKTESRTSSAVSLRMSNRQNRSLMGSFSKFTLFGADER